MGKESKGFCLFYDWVEVLSDLDPADAMEVIKAISAYKQTGADPVEACPKHVRAVVRMMYQQILRSEQVSEIRASAAKAMHEKKDAETCNANAEQKDADAEQRSTTKTETETKTETITENIKETLPNGRAKKIASRFSAPTIDEVRDYCNENGYRIDAEAFVDHYQSVGWKVGNKPMKDWKAAVRTWVRRDREKMPKKGESSFDTDDFFEAASRRAYAGVGA